MLQDLKGGPAIAISKSSGYPRWSPDGSELAVDQSDGLQRGIFLVSRLGGPPRFIAGGNFSCWSPDGSQIATAWKEEVGFRIVDKVTRSVKSIRLNGFRWINDLDWSPASNLLAVLTLLQNGRYAIWTVHPDGSQQRKVIEEAELESPRWSPAGDGIYFLRHSRGNTNDLLEVAINSKSGQAKAPAAVLLSGLQVGGYFTVSADGTRLAYARGHAYSNLWLAQFQSPDYRKETGRGPQTTSLTRGTSWFDSPRISPDGKWIAFVTQGHIYKMAIEGGTSIQLTLSNVKEFNPAWSPDGKRIAFGSNEGGVYKVWSVDADGANRRQFAKTQLSAYDGAQITWSPGRHILYQSPGNRNFSILDPETEEEKPLVQNESVGWLFFPRYSPDGKKVAVHWNRPPKIGLWIISLNDNSETFLPGSYLYPAGWAPDGSSIYARDADDGDKMLSIPVGPASRGTPHTVFTAPGDIGDASVSADGKNFVFSAAESKSDEWEVDDFDPAYRK